MGRKINEILFGRVVFLIGEDIVRAENDRAQDKYDIGQVHPCLAAKEYDFEPLHHRRPKFLVPFIQLRGLTARGREDCHLSTKPFGKQEGLNNRERVVRSHPRHSFRISLTDEISRRKIDDIFVDSVDDHGEERKTNEPDKLIVGYVRHHSTSIVKDDWYSEQREDKEDRKHGRNGVDEARSTLHYRHSFDQGTI